MGSFVLLLAAAVAGAVCSTYVETCTWIGSTPVGTNCNAPFVSCYTVGGVATLWHMPGALPYLIRTSFLQMDYCYWGPTSLRPFPFSDVDPQNVLVAYDKVPNQHIVMHWRYPAAGVAQVDCTLNIHVTSGSCLGLTVPSATSYAALPYAAAPLVFTGLPASLTASPATLGSPQLPGLASSIAAGTAALAARCNVCDVERVAGISPGGSGGRRLQGNCFRRAIRATVVCGLGIAVGSAVAVGSAPIGFGVPGAVIGTGFAVSVCNRAWTPAIASIGRVVDRVRTSVLTGIRGRSLGHDDAARWLQAADGVLVANLTTPFSTTNSTLIAQVVLIPEDEVAGFFSNATLVQALWGEVMAPVLSNATLFNATFAGLNAAMVNLTGSPVVLGNTLMAASDGGFVPMPGYNNTNVTVVDASPSATPSVSPSVSPSATGSATRSGTPTPSPTPSLSTGASPSQTSTATSTASTSPSSTQGSSPTATASPTRSTAVLTGGGGGGGGGSNNSGGGQSSALPAAVGGAVGGAVVVAAAVLVYCYCCKVQQSCSKRPRAVTSFPKGSDEGVFIHHNALAVATMQAPARTFPGRTAV
jgi:hypothetical protein